MSKTPGGVTARIDCMIISGFPGIGKTSTYNEMKKSFIGARVVDMDVKNFGTTNGMDVADPAKYVAQVDALSKENALILVTIDPIVRAKMRDAHLFYMIMCPEFPLHVELPPGTNYQRDPMAHANYMRRFQNNLSYFSKAGQTLDGNGYDSCIMEAFTDPMPHIITSELNKAVVDRAWMMVEQLSRQVVQPSALNTLQQAQPTPPPNM